MGKHFMSWYGGKLRLSFILNWFLEFWFYLFDLLGIPEFYECFTLLVKWNTRPLNEAELNIAKELFGEAISLKTVSADEYAIVGPKQFHFAYVGFHTINHYTSMNPSLLVHELVHILQYEREGSVYIPRALKAQRSKEGYAYGGPNRMVQMHLDGETLDQLNYEQQAEVFKDYYRLKNTDQNTKASEYLPFYRKLIQDFLRPRQGEEREILRHDTKP